jgi:hypothetical protein
VSELEHRSSQARRAWRLRDVPRMRQTVEHLAQLSDHAQRSIHPHDDMDYTLRSAVILTHIEVSALQRQLA